MHDLLFEKLGEWGGHSEDDFQDWVTSQAEDMDLDIEQFAEDLTSEALVNQVKEAWEVNSEIGLPGTPFLALFGLTFAKTCARVRVTTMGSVAESARIVLLKPRPERFGAFLLAQLNI